MLQPRRRNLASDRRSYVFVVTAVLVAFVAMAVGILKVTHGHFAYSLDDPYIHLTLARNIASGSYGITPGTPASPASSVLWPFLLAPTSAFWFQDWVPLAVNLVCAALSAVLILFSALRVVRRRWAAVLITLSTLLLFNIVGVAFTGMEHSLQVLAALAVGLGTVLVVRGQRPPVWFLVAIAVGPMVRYENAAPSVAAAVVLAVSGHRRTALLVTAAWLAVVGAFSGFLMSLGLSPIPNSVLVKSDLGRPGQDVAPFLVDRLQTALDERTFVVALLLLLVDLMLRRTWTRLHTFLALVLGGHALAGHFGWWGRYELYLLAACCAPLLDVVSTWPRVARGTRLLPYVAAAVVVWACIPLAAVTLRTPEASHQVWSQQGQTAVFVRDYWKRPIAVNDLGLVAYRGEQPVLDVWGLASTEARVDRLHHREGWLGRITAEHRVQLAAIFTDWFRGHIPRHWVRVGSVGAPAAVVTPSPVDFWVTDPEVVPRACQAMAELQRRESNTDTAVSLTRTCRD